MLDINFIRDNQELVTETARKKNKDPLKVGEVLTLDKKRRELLSQVQVLRTERNQVAKAKDFVRGKEIKVELGKIEPELREIEEQFQQALWEIPNIISEDTPEGKDETENVVIRKHGKPKNYDFEPKDHMELGEALDIIDTKTAAKVTGARFAYLKGDGAMLEIALLNFAISVLTNQKTLGKIASSVKKDHSDKTFSPVFPPVMIRPDIFDRMGRLKPEDDRFHIPSDDLYLIGSAEHTLGPIHMDQTLSEKDMPIRYVGFSTSFRREAGSYGKDTKGILRVHQFDKIEMESFTLPENSIDEQNFFVAIQEYLMQQLELPYQVVQICTGDIGGPDYRQIDIETWLPGQNKYRETHTSDLMTDYQSRRLNTKVHRKGGEKQLVHMNDATVFAIGRTIIAILENYQNEDGSITVPKVLQQYLGKEVIS